MRSGRFRRLTLLPLLGAGFIWVLGAGPAVAQTAPVCALEIGGLPLAQADAPERAISIDADSTVLVAVGSPRPVSWVDVTISVWPFPPAIIPLRPPEPMQLWAGELPVAEYSKFGAGLYQVAATTDVPGCEARGWVNVTGRSPLETPAGWVGLGIVTVGVLVALRAVFSRRTSGLVAVAGGVITGLGLLLLAQQAGLHAITPQSAVVWTVLPGAIAGAANAVVGALTSAAPAGGGAAAGAGAGAVGGGPVGGGGAGAGAAGGGAGTAVGGAGTAVGAGTVGGAAEITRREADEAARHEAERMARDAAAAEAERPRSEAGTGPSVGGGRCGRRDHRGHG